MTHYFTKSGTIITAPADTNDGKDVFGFGLTAATFTNATKTLTQTGAFTSYTFTSGDTIAITGGTGVTTGLYEIASRVDNDSITLVNDIGGTNPTDVTSSSGPFLTIQKLFDTTTAGDVGHICADATYTLTANLDIDTNASTDTAPIVFSGATSRGVIDGTMATIDGNATAAQCIDIGVVSQPNLQFWNIRATNGTQCGWYLNKNASSVTWVNCRADNHAHATYAGFCYNTYSISMSLFGCEADNNTGSGIGSAGGNAVGEMVIDGCSIHDNATYGVRSEYSRLAIRNSYVYDNGTDGLWVDSNVNAAETSGVTISNCTIQGNAQSGIFLDVLAGDEHSCMIYNTVVCDNGNYGLETTAQVTDYVVQAVSCLFNNNTSGDTDLTNGLRGWGNLTSAPQFTSTTDGSEDFTPQTASPLQTAAMFGGISAAYGGDPALHIGAAQGGRSSPSVSVLGKKIIPIRWGSWR